ncbi:aldo/keto reductase [Secundilactobacillus collinoides]|uniref:aldo/keto reductase n=1 Tax=Secundilactobacillus collinoides TaxID=33960 RepID=UPI000AB93710
MTTEQTPKIALGTWAWGDAGGDDYFGGNVKTEVNLRPVVDAAMRSGLTFWDTAYAYGTGASEKILGNLLQSYKRQEYVLSTKFTPGMTADSETAMSDMLAAVSNGCIRITWICTGSITQPTLKNGHRS